MATVPFDIVETGFRPVAPSSELMASLNADNKSRMDMIVELDKINILTRRCRNDERLEEKLTTHDHRASGSGAL
jgi:hypothetical protein